MYQALGGLTSPIKSTFFTSLSPTLTGATASDTPQDPPAVTPPATPKPISRKPVPGTNVAATKAALLNQAAMSHNPDTQSASTTYSYQDSTDASPPSTSSTAPSIHHNAQFCARCGGIVDLKPDEWSAVSKQAQVRIEELEKSVKDMGEKADASNEKLKAYESELFSLRDAQRHANTHSNAPDAPPVPAKDHPPLSRSNTEVMPDSSSDASAVAAPARTAVASRPVATLGRSLTTTTRITNFLSRRNVTAPVSAPQTPADIPQPSPSGSAPELSAALDREQSLRKAAESKLSQTNSEMEELSAQLFQQANEMVAAERKARHHAEAKLEAKAVELEAKSSELEVTAVQAAQAAKAKKATSILETQERTKALEKRCKWLEERVRALEMREVERSKRLDRLEKAMGRVGRVRGLLDQSMVERSVAK